MVERQQVFRELLARCPIDCRESLSHRIDFRRQQPWFDENLAQRIDVAADGNSAEQRGFEQRRPAPHEWVVDCVPCSREALRKEPRELRLEARAIGNFVETVRGALAARPKLIDEGIDPNRPVIDAHRRCEYRSGFAVPAEFAQLLSQWCPQVEMLLLSTVFEQGAL